MIRGRARSAGWIIACALAAACGAGPQPRATEIGFAPAASGLPFSESVRIDGLLLLSGQIGVGADGRLVEGGIVAETRQTLDNIAGALARQGADLNDVVKCTVMLADISEWHAMNEVYVEYFDRNLPVRSAFATSGLALGARVEIECWAMPGR
jgi:2-iminobutanoate/2-iminopropanoate deaminase